MSVDLNNEEKDGWVSVNIRFFESPNTRVIVTKCKTEEEWTHLQRLIEFNITEEPPDVMQNETPYKCPPREQTLVKLLLVNQTAVGFYIVRLKGKQGDGGLPLELPILDGVFIRKAYRRQGWGTVMIKDILQQFPDQDIGLSQPISHSLESVVKKLLSGNPQHRDRLWSVENCGEEGDRLNLWLTLACKKAE